MPIENVFKQYNNIHVYKYSQIVYKFESKCGYP